MNPRVQTVKNIKEILADSLKKPGFYGQNFLEELSTIVAQLERLEIALEGVDPVQFQAVSKLGYQAATSSIPLEEALATHLVTSKQA